MMDSNIEEILDESDKYAAENAARLSHDEVFVNVRRFTGLFDYTDYVESKLAEAVDLARIRTNG